MFKQKGNNHDYRTKTYQNKLGLLEVSIYLNKVSEACRVMGYSRDTFYQVKNAYEEGGLDALKEQSRRAPNPKNRVSEDIEKDVMALALEDPFLGQKRASGTLGQRSVFIPPVGSAVYGFETA